MHTKKIVDRAPSVTSAPVDIIAAIHDPEKATTGQRRGVYGPGIIVREPRLADAHVMERAMRHADRRGATGLCGSPEMGLYDDALGSSRHSL